MIGRLKDLTMNIDGSQNITVTVKTDFRDMFEELKEKDINVEIKKYSKRRSLDSNALAWVLIDKLAEKLRMKKIEVYQNAIKDIGGVSDVICVRDFAVEQLCSGWKAHGMGWMTECSKSKLPGCTNVTLWYGSSVFDTKQMSDLINNLIQDCNEQGIPTMTQDEIDRSLVLWGKKRGEGNDEEHPST